MSLCLLDHIDFLCRAPWKKNTTQYRVSSRYMRSFLLHFSLFFLLREKKQKKNTTKRTLSTVEFWRDLSHSSPFVKNFFQVWPNRRVTSVWTWHTNPPFPPRAKERVTTDIVDCDVIVYLMQFNVLMGIEIYMHDIRCWLKLFFLFREERSWE